MLNPSIKQDILSVIDQALVRIRLRDFTALKELSNHTIHNASMFQDPDSVSIAVVMYALSKIADRSQDPSYLKKIAQAFQKCKQSLQKNNITAYRNCIKSIFKVISSYDIKFKIYVEEVIDKAQVKKGSKIYEHGISIAKTAEILGVGQWELMSYIGKTRIHDEFVGRVDVRKRIEFARGLFK